ncbi:MAG: hypothetical protein ACI9JN_000082 [Bacteroidia bacterium]
MQFWSTLSYFDNNLTLKRLLYWSFQNVSIKVITKENLVRLKGNLFVSVITCLLLFLHAFSLQAQTKKGLIIAIGDYPESGQTPDWRDISSVNDIPLIPSALQKQGFQTEHIDILKNEQATKEGIVTAIKSLTKTSQKGDVVIIHFSSHGQQIEDDNGNEIDGYDEAICNLWCTTCL